MSEPAVVTRIAAHRFDNGLRYRTDDHPDQVQLTPPYVLGPVILELGGTIGLDPCTLPTNPCAAQTFYAPPQDGAVLPWEAATIFVNPPYSKARERWVKRCVQAGVEGRKVILLMPAATDTRIFQYAMETADAVCFIKGRVKFGILRPNRRQVAASHPSALLGWNVWLTSCEDLGLVMRQS